MRADFLGCCARAASGHAAAPPSSAMNARRLIRPPRPPNRREATPITLSESRTAKVSPCGPGWGLRTAEKRARNHSRFGQRQAVETFSVFARHEHARYRLPEATETSLSPSAYRGSPRSERSPSAQALAASEV